MHSLFPLLLSRRALYALSGIAVLVAVVFPGPLSWLLLLGAGVNLARALPHRWQRWGGPLVLLGTLGLLSPRPAKALFGEDVAVLLQQLLQLRQQFAELQKIYSNSLAIINNTKAAVDLAKYNVQSLTTKRGLEARLLTLGTLVPAPNRQGELNGWDQALQRGVNISGAYAHATLPVTGTLSFLTPQTFGSSPHWANLAQVGITDAATQNTMQAIAQVLQQQTANQAALNQWKTGVLTTDASLQTAATQANFTNLGLLQLYGQNQANLALQTALAQSVASLALRDRNAAVASLNRWQKMSDYAANETFTLGGMEADLHQHQPY